MLTREPESFRRRRAEVAPPEALHARIRAAVAKTSTSRVRTGRRIVLALVLALIVSVAAVGIGSQMIYQQQAVGLTVGAQSEVHLQSVFLLLAGITAVSTYFALTRGRRGFGAGAMALATVGFLVAPVYALLMLSSPVHVPDAGVAGHEISTYGWRCMILAGVVGIAVMTSFAFALRRAVPVASTLRAGVLGAAAGAWAGLAVFVFCPSGQYPHLIGGHVLPVLALTVLGLLALPRVLRP